MKEFKMTIKETDINRNLQPTRYRTCNFNVVIPTDMVEEKGYDFVFDVLKDGIDKLKEVSLDNGKDGWKKVRRHIFDLCKGCEYLNSKNNCIMGMEHPTTDCVESIFKAKKKKEKK